MDVDGIPAVVFYSLLFYKAVVVVVRAVYMCITVSHALWYEFSTVDRSVSVQGIIIHTVHIVFVNMYSHMVIHMWIHLKSQPLLDVIHNVFHPLIVIEHLLYLLLGVENRGVVLFVESETYLL